MNGRIRKKWKSGDTFLEREVFVKRFSERMEGRHLLSLDVLEKAFRVRYKTY